MSDSKDNVVNFEDCRKQEANDKAIEQILLEYDIRTAEQVALHIFRHIAMTTEDDEFVATDRFYFILNQAREIISNKLK